MVWPGVGIEAGAYGNGYLSCLIKQTDRDNWAGLCSNWICRAPIEGRGKG